MQNNIKVNNCLSLSLKSSKNYVKNKLKVHTYYPGFNGIFFWLNQNVLAQSKHFGWNSREIVIHIDDVPRREVDRAGKRASEREDSQHVSISEYCVNSERRVFPIHTYAFRSSISMISVPSGTWSTKWSTCEDWNRKTGIKFAPLRTNLLTTLPQILLFLRCIPFSTLLRGC